MKRDFFRETRRNAIHKLGGGVVVLSAYTSLQSSADMAAPFKQEANFWYLTGIDKPDWRLIIDGARGKSWLVAPVVSDIHAVFDGSLSAQDAIKISGVDAVLSHDEADSLLRDLAKRHSLVYSLGEDPHAEYYSFVLNPAPKKLWRQLERTFIDVQDCRLELAKLRAIKRPVELKAIKKAIKLTIEGFELVKQKLPELSHEYEVEAEFTYYFRRHGAAGHAYEPIVAGGKNACTLHYDANADRLRQGSLLLMDIGAGIDGYPADITRTCSIGAPTKRQCEVHAAVQRAHQTIIALLRPGLSVTEYQIGVDHAMKEALQSLGLMNSFDDEKTYRRYFPHAISHGLGVDVHDSLGRPTELLPGMVLTVEPGIYVPEESIGVRLEDDILITDHGHSNLSAKLSLEL